MGTWNVIVKGGNYMISEAIYMREPVPMMSGATKSPGFYLNMGGGNILDAEWVEWWIPMPSLPNAEHMDPPTQDSAPTETLQRVP